MLLLSIGKVHELHFRWLKIECITPYMLRSVHGLYTQESEVRRDGHNRIFL